MNDTIFALSTLFGKSGIAVFRVSGPLSIQKLKELAMDKAGNPRLSFKPNTAYYSQIINPLNKEPIDEAIALFFKAPHSFTGEDCFELQTHGSVAVIKDLLATFLAIGLRPAEPGEFAKRAFLNNKMDLTRAEGLADLIEAETTIQRRVALRQLQGNNENLYENWRQSLIALLANIEALIDFPDEDLPNEVLQDIALKVGSLKESIADHLKNSTTGEILKEGVRIAIIGEPNAGKSSLLNALAKKDVAIVSDIPGTTRDVIEVKLDLDGYPVYFCDTAGLRESNDAIEKIGVTRARATIDQSHLVLLLSTKTDHELLIDMSRHKCIKVITKADVHSIRANDCIALSALTTEGIEELLNSIKAFIHNNYEVSSSPLVTQSRYKYHLELSLNHLTAFKINLPLELAAEELRVAAAEIGKITGKIDLEEILDSLFGKFCIGK